MTSAISSVPVSSRPISPPPSTVRFSARLGCLIIFLGRCRIQDPGALEVRALETSRSYIKHPSAAVMNHSTRHSRVTKHGGLQSASHKKKKTPAPHVHPAVTLSTTSELLPRALRAFKSVPSRSSLMTRICPMLLRYRLGAPAKQLQEIRNLHRKLTLRSAKFRSRASRGLKSVQLRSNMIRTVRQG